MRRKYGQYSQTWKASVHDLSQLEIVVDYSCDRAAGSSETAVKDGHDVDFSIDLIFFAPKNIDLNTASYPKEKFYRDLKNLTRIHTPVMEMCQKCSLPTVDQYFAHGVNIHMKRLVEGKAVQEVKLFGNYINLLIKRAFKLQTKDQLHRLEEILYLVDKYRTLYVRPVDEKQAFASDIFQEAIHFVDEYMGRQIRNLCIEVARHGPHEVITEIIKEEDQYLQRYMHSVDLKNDGLEREKFYHRLGQLKKYVSEILFLKSRQIKRDVWYRNAAAAAGASVAAVWTQFMAAESSFTRGATDFGFKFMFMVLLAVIVYVFKDRIKEWSKEYLNQRIRLRLPDVESELIYTYADAGAKTHDLSAAHVREVVRYLKCTQVPDSVRYLRDLIFKRERLVALNESVIHYSKTVKLAEELMQGLGVERISIKDIYRFNVSRFLSLLDDPSKNMVVFDTEEEVPALLKATKAYYFDIALQFTTYNQTLDGKVDKHVQLEFMRLVLNKNGIVRLDPLLPKNKFAYQEVMHATP